MTTLSTALTITFCFAGGFFVGAWLGITAMALMQINRGEVSREHLDF